MDRICVVGAGTMGNGIAHIFAQNGFQVSLYDIDQAYLDDAMRTIGKNLGRQVSKGLIDEDTRQIALDNISTSTNLENSVGEAGLVVEAATESFDVKKKIFVALSNACPDKSVLATNTSSISITKLAGVTDRPAQVVGMHFMNPVPVMNLVEIIKGYATSKETIKAVEELSIKIKKIPLVVKDYPGFVSNRILMPMINEAIYTLFEGVGGVDEIDNIMKLGMAHPMGPLRLADFIGLDVCLSILNVLNEGFGNPKYAPCPLLVNMVAAGNLGVKSKQGFYNYHHSLKEPEIAEQFLI